MLLHAQVVWELEGAGMWYRSACVTVVNMLVVCGI